MGELACGGEVISGAVVRAARARCESEEREGVKWRSLYLFFAGRP